MIQSMLTTTKLVGSGRRRRQPPSALDDLRAWRLAVVDRWRRGVGPTLAWDEPGVGHRFSQVSMIGRRSEPLPLDVLICR
jgi:hypothetical protein